MNATIITKGESNQPITGIKEITVMAATNINDIFFRSVSLAVAAVPEGLPAVVTIALVIGAANIARKKALARKLPVIEMLGAVSVICTDKTGTLTENKMAVVRHWPENSGKEMFELQDEVMKEEDGVKVGEIMKKVLSLNGDRVKMRSEVAKQFEEFTEYKTYV